MGGTAFEACPHTWAEIEAQDFEPATGANLVIDTAHTSLDDAVEQIRAHLGGG